MADTLSREEMESVIKSGASIMHKGVIHTSLDTLPDEAELAQGDQERMDRERERLMKQKRDIEAQIARIGTEEEQLGVQTTPGKRTKRQDNSTTTELGPQVQDQTAPGDQYVVPQAQP